MVERLTKNMTEGREGHEFRYRLAAGFVRSKDVILDAACGTGYGADLVRRAAGSTYFGVDRDLQSEVDELPGVRTFIEADLTTWEPDFAYDVFVSFETIEHLDDYTNLVRLAKRAGRWILMSVPVVPTKHINPFHVHDFEPGDLCRLIGGVEWRHFQTVQQPSELSEISVFERRT